MKPKDMHKLFANPSNLGVISKKFHLVKVLAIFRLVQNNVDWQFRFNHAPRHQLTL